jgi:hypothetical protein
MNNKQVTALEREELAETLHLAILKLIDSAGYRNGHVAEVAHSAAKMVASRVTERKKAK